MENEQPKVSVNQRPPRQPGTGESYQQKWNYDEIPDLNRLKEVAPPQAEQPSQKAKRLRRVGSGVGGQAGVVHKTTATTRATRARRRPNEVRHNRKIRYVSNRRETVRGVDIYSVVVSISAWLGLILGQGSHIFGVRTWLLTLATVLWCRLS